MVTFDDLMDAMSLIEHNNGVRSYILQWYNDVFIPAYESKIVPDTKDRGGVLLSENRCAVTTRELVEILNKRLQLFQIRIEDPALYPDEIYIIHEIDRVLEYSSDERD